MIHRSNILFWIFSYVTDYDWSSLTDFQLRSGSEQCPPNYCKNGGVCLPLSNSRQRCLCEPGFTGGQCETRITTCTENPCREPSNPNLPKFQCTDDPSGGTSYTCNCTTESSGYSGVHCEEEVLIVLQIRVKTYFDILILRNI